ncbi:uncharacterized protein [Hemitrygon akajei]|uniref:uncharacterized protein isoform X2 n=1 Tax=Hemitrygon akajei TaxID=2704970 RepID=UPI003BF95910
MTDSTLPIGLLMFFVIAFCRPQDNAPFQTEVVEETDVLSRAHIALEHNSSEHLHSKVILNHSERVTFFEKAQEAITNIPLHTHLSSQSSISETLRPSKRTKAATDEINKESHKPKENSTSEDEFLDSQPVTSDPSVINSLEDIAKAMPTLLPHTYETISDINQSEMSVLSLKAWKFGLISAALPLFLIVEAFALAIYCTKCKKRGRKTISTKSCDDSEAAETINAESNENTVTVNNTSLSQINNPLETSETQDFSEVEQETMDD